MRRLLLGCCLVGLCMGSCVSADIYEPDIDHLYAGRIATNGRTQVRTLFPAGDEDWVIFHVAATSHTTITCELTAGEVITVDLYDANLQQLTTGQSTYMSIENVLDPGDYYLNVTQPDGHVIPEYSLSVLVYWDAYEPDDTAASASNIPTDGSVQPHSISLRSDSDWTTFALDRSQVVVIEAWIDVSINVSVQLELYDADLNLLANAMHGYVSRITETLTAGQYYVATQASRNTTLKQYQLAVHAVSEDSSEPDSLMQPVVIPTDGMDVLRSISPSGDTDWMTFTLNQAGSVAIAKRGHSASSNRTTLYSANDNQTTLWLYDANLKELKTVLGDEPLVQSLDAGQYYMKLQARNDEEVIPQYAVSVHTILDDPYEPDNTMSQAVTIPTDGSLQHHSITSSDDTDWLTFSLDSPGYVAVESNSRWHDIQLHVYDENQMELRPAGRRPAQAGQNTVWGFFMEAGQYTMNVDMVGWGYHMAAEYALAVHIMPADDYEPDNNVFQATPITTYGSEQLHRLFPTDPEDWLTFSLDSATIAAIDIQSWPDSSVSLNSLEVLDSNLNRVPQTTMGRTGRGRTVAGGSSMVYHLPADQYYLKMAGSSQVAEYTVSVLDLESVEHDKVMLTVHSSRGGYISEPGRADFEYDLSETAHPIMAHANPGYRFSTWTGSAVDTGKVANPDQAHTTITFSADETPERAYTLVANFVPAPVVNVGNMSIDDK